MAQLVLADGDLRRFEHEYVGGHEDGISEETDGIVLAHAHVLDFLLEGRDPLGARDAAEHGEYGVKLGDVGNLRLDVERGLVRVHADGEPVHYHLQRVALDLADLVVVGRQHVEVGHEEKAVVIVLEFYAVNERAHEVPEVKPAGGSIARDKDWFCACRHVSVTP